jgi:Reverse transcriptase (RNA-dependent DNA polymerase)
MLLPDILLTFNHVLSTPGQTLKPLNDSYIVLIPKKNGATEVGDFRPISLINSMQKCFSKILTNRLQTVIDQLVSTEQTGFLRNRHINKGFLYAQELITQATKQKSQIGLFKADIFKSFDTLSWDFLIDVLKAKGFSQNWVQWIKSAVLKGTSQVLLNSVVGRKIQLKRGVRQGDPLSPYLFILAADFLPVWFEALSRQNLIIKPFPQCRQCLLYANDMLFIIQPEEQQVRILKALLNIYEKISGLKVNLQKSEMLVTSVDQQFVQMLADIMECVPSNFSNHISRNAFVG